MYSVGLADGVLQLAPWVGEHPADPHDRGVDRADTDRAAEDLADDVGDVATRQPVHARQDRDVRLKARPERRAGHAVGQRGERALAAASAAQPPQPMLEDQRRDRRQLPLLMDHGLAETLIVLIEAMPAIAALGQVLKTLVARSAGAISRVLPSWPGWPPGFLSDAFARSRASARRC